MSFKCILGLLPLMLIALSTEVQDTLGFLKTLFHITDAARRFISTVTE